MSRDAVSSMSVEALMDVMGGRLNIIEEVLGVIDKYYNTKSSTDKVRDEINEARRIMKIYRDYFISTGQIEEPISTEQTDDFDGHPNTII